MPFTLADLAYGFAAPAGAAAVVFVLVRRLWPGDGLRFAGSVALAAGFWTGYWLLQLGALIPGSHWEWIGYAALLSLTVGPTACAAGVSSLERTLPYVLISLFSAVLLAPQWDDLSPSPTVHIVVWTGLAVVVMTLLEPLSARWGGSFLAAVYGVVAMTGSAVLMLAGSMRFAQILGCAVGALFGLFVVCLLDGRRPRLIGVAATFTILVAGMLLIGRVQSFSDVPLASYILPVIAPATLWLGAVRPIASLTGWGRTAAACFTPLLLCVVAVGVAVVAEFAG